MYHFQTDGVVKYDMSSEALIPDVDQTEGQDEFLSEILSAYEQDETDKFLILQKLIKYLEKNKYTVSDTLHDEEILNRLMDLSTISPELMYYSLCSLLKLIEHDIDDHFLLCVLKNYDVTKYFIEQFQCISELIIRECIINLIDVLCFCAHKVSKADYFEIIPYQFVCDIFELATPESKICFGVSRIIYFLSMVGLYPQLIPLIHDVIMENRHPIDAIKEYAKAYLNYSQFYPEQIDFSETLINTLQNILPRDCYLMFITASLKYIDITIDPSIILGDLSEDDPTIVKIALNLVRSYIVLHDNDKEKENLESFISGFIENGGLKIIRNNIENRDYSENLIIISGCIFALLSEEQIFEICKDREFVNFFVDSFDEGISDYLCQIALLGIITAFVRVEAVHGETYIADLIADNGIDEIAIYWAENNHFKVEGDVASMLDTVREILGLEEE